MKSIFITVVLFIALGVNAQSPKTYEGEWQQDKRHGYGKMTYQDDSVYDGQWVNNERTGKGVMTFANGDVYNGLWLNDKFSGYGSMNYASTESYVGFWKNNKRNGYGEMKFVNGDHYEGSWKNDKMVGIGKFEKANGETYKGELNKEYEGLGILETATGDLVQGAFNNGKVEGEATIFYKSGEQYQGETKDGLPDGTGTYFYADNSYYEGEIKKGIPDGMGKKIDANGNMLEGGRWKKGQLKQTYEQIQRGQQALREGVMALGQGMVAVGKQMQAHDAQMKQMTAANKAKMAQFNQSIRKQQKQYDQLYNKKLNELNSNPYSKNDPMNSMTASFYARQQMASNKSASVQQETPKTVAPASGYKPSVPTYRPPVANNTSGIHPPAKQKVHVPEPWSRENTNNTGSTVVKKYYKDVPHQLETQYRAKVDEHGEIITPHVCDGFYQSWYKDGKKQEESNYIDGDYDGEYKFWNKQGRIEAFSTFKTHMNSKATIEINWYWEKGELKDISLQNLRAEDGLDNDRKIFEVRQSIANHSYEYSDKARRLTYTTASAGNIEYRHDNLSYSAVKKNGKIISEHFYDSGNLACTIEYYPSGQIKGIFDDQHYYHKQTKSPFNDWGSIEYDENGNKKNYVDKAVTYQAAMKKREEILQLYKANYPGISQKINQYLPIMNPNRYK